RLGLIDRTRSFTEVLSERGLVLRSEWLLAWSRWITPEGQKRRYDTFFFVAELPPGQNPRDVGGEADLSQWATRPWSVRSGSPAGYRCLPRRWPPVWSWHRHGPWKVCGVQNGISCPLSRKCGRSTVVSGPFCRAGPVFPFPRMSRSRERL